MKPATSNLATAGVCQGPSSDPTRRKVTVLGELRKIWGLPFNISAKAEASNFKFGTQLGIAKAYHKITPTGKLVVALG